MIWCCKDCIAPKRYPGCHGSCPEYIKEKEIHDKEREELRKKKALQDGLDSQAAKGIRRANSRMKGR